MTASLVVKRLVLNRGRLFYEIVRIAKHHKPLVLLLKNVKTILTLDKGGVISTIEKSLSPIGGSITAYSTPANTVCHRSVNGSILSV